MENPARRRPARLLESLPIALGSSLSNLLAKNPPAPLSLGVDRIRPKIGEAIDDLLYLRLRESCIERGMRDKEPTTGLVVSWLLLAGRTDHNSNATRNRP